VDFVAAAWISWSVFHILVDVETWLSHMEMFLLASFSMLQVSRVKQMLFRKVDIFRKTSKTFWIEYLENTVFISSFNMCADLLNSPWLRALSIEQ